MYWWGKQFSIGIISAFFLVFGIDLLISSYHLNNPHEFIMCFFASNLMILISAVGVLYPTIRIFTRLKTKDTNEDDTII
jgi:hypothetical protein